MGLQSTVVNLNNDDDQSEKDFHLKYFFSSHRNVTFVNFILLTLATLGKDLVLLRSCKLFTFSSNFLVAWFSCLFFRSIITLSTEAARPAGIFFSLVGLLTSTSVSGIFTSFFNRKKAKNKARLHLSWRKNFTCFTTLSRLSWASTGPKVSGSAHHSCKTPLLLPCIPKRHLPFVSTLA